MATATKFKLSALVALFVETGSKTAGEWSVKRMQEKVTKIAKVIGDDNAPETKEGKATLKNLLAALESGEGIEIEDDSKTAAKTEDKPAPKKGKAKPAATEDDDAEETEDDDAEDSETEDEDEEPAPKKGKGKAKPAEKAKAKPAKKAEPKEERGPGVIASIVEFLGAATEEKPINKDRLVEKLKKRFPDRQETAMMKTINVQVPNRLKTDKKINVKKNDKGYWIPAKKGKE